MNNGSAMKRIEIPIRTKVKKIVDMQCPVKPGIWKEFDYEQCKVCSYFIPSEGDGKCCYQEYRTEIREQGVEIEEDPYGADIPNYYYWTFKCADCGSEIEFCSTYSSFYEGDKAKCSKCGLLHTFLRYEGGAAVFAIPVKGRTRSQ
jgi:hypothetical protein